MSLMGKNNNHSVLNDDAALFQMQESKSERQKWSEMNTQQRLQYFRDYYLIKCLVCIAAAGITAAVLWSTFRPKKECILFIAVVHDYLLPQEKNQLAQQLAQSLITDTEREEIQIDDVFPSGYESDTKLSTYLAAQEIDLIITNEEHFNELAEAGCFEELHLYMPEFANTHSDLLCLSDTGSNEDTSSEKSYTNEADMEENDTAGYSSVQTNSDNKNAAYGIYLTDNGIIQNAADSDRRLVAGIVKGSLRKENAAAALTEVFFAK